MSDHGCIHLNNFKAAKGIQPYKIIHAYFVACTTAEARSKKALACFCHVCNSFGPRLHSCLHCIFFGCYTGGHIQEHAKVKKHFLAVDLTYGTVLCFQCGDYVYDRELATVAHRNRLKAAKSLGIPTVYRTWEPSNRELDLLKRNPRRCKIIENTSIGLRGLLNLGNTCFMNSIVQALTHTPLLRDFFLADRHLCKFQGEPGQCIVCEVSRLFREFYSGNKTPLTLNRLLHLIWINARHLAGYVQQDAHEFFIATLDMMHRHCTESNLPTINPHNCNCIIDKIFTGRLQSDVVCQSCNGVSTTIDPFWDISLDLAASSESEINCSNTGNNNQGLSEQSQQLHECMSLIHCLERFTRAEHLDMIKCSKCQSYQNSTKQLTMKKLPVVVIFHLKRFEHDIELKIRKKIATFVAFPEHLDMTPFMSQHGNQNNNHSFGGLNSVTVSDNRYSLFAVINHVGNNIEAGHYTAFVRQQRNYWYKCDDHLITKANLQDVLGSEGYLLFYHKQILEYE